MATFKKYLRWLLYCEYWYCLNCDNDELRLVTGTTREHACEVFAFVWRTVFCQCCCIVCCWIMVRSYELWKSKYNTWERNGYVYVLLQMHLRQKDGSVCLYTCARSECIQWRNLLFTIANVLRIVEFLLLMPVCSYRNVTQGLKTRRLSLPRNWARGPNRGEGF